MHLNYVTHGGLFIYLCRYVSGIVCHEMSVPYLRYVNGEHLGVKANHLDTHRNEFTQLDMFCLDHSMGL